MSATVVIREENILERENRGEREREESSYQNMEPFMIYLPCSHTNTHVHSVGTTLEQRGTSSRCIVLGLLRVASGGIVEIF